MSNIVDIKVPDIGDFEDVEIIEVLISNGDRVNEEDPLITLESDKASMEVPSTHSGLVRELKVKVGDRVSEGSVILSLESGEVQTRVDPPSPDGVQETDSSPPQSKNGKTGKPVYPVADNSAGEVRNLSIVNDRAFVSAHASPSIRAWARELGADLSQIRGTGPKGRVIREDVTSYVKGRSNQKPDTFGGMAIPPFPVVDHSEFGETEEVPLSRIRRKSGPFLLSSWLNIPHVTHNDESDITDLDRFRKELDTNAKQSGYRITILSFIMKAVAASIRAYPEFNSSLSPDGENLIIKKYYHVGIAVDTPMGLVVPVVRNVEKKGIIDLSKELGEISSRARDGKLTPQDLQGGSISISSLGGIGGTSFTPIVKAPEVAIVGVTRAQMKPVWNGENFEPRLMLPISVSYDHRVIDGALAARFTSYLSQALTDSRRLLL